jgi:RimJ/RimL family protein N-acetyltransferase
MQIYCLQKIETPRTILRPFQMGDELALNEAINRSLGLLQRWMPWAKDPSLAATRTFVHESVASWETKKGDNFPFVVIHKPTQKIIGASGFNEDTIPAQGIYTIGYWLDVVYQGQGLVTEFVNGLTRYALEHLHAQIVQIFVDQANTKSIAVPHRLGFIPTPITNQQTTLDLANTLLFTRVNTSLLPPLAVTYQEDEAI